MTLPSTSRLAAPALLALALLLVAGCGDEQTPAASASPTVTSDSGSPVVATTPAAEVRALSLTEHVLGPRAFPGFTTDQAAEVMGLAAFAKEHHKTVAELEASGMVAGAGVTFEPVGGGHGFALSIAAAYASPEQAEAEAARLFGVNSMPDPGASAEPVEVTGVPGARAVRLSGKQHGQPFTGTDIVFVDDTVVHEVFAIGVDPMVAVSDIVAAATSLYRAVAGHPLAQ